MPAKAVSRTSNPHGHSVENRALAKGLQLIDALSAAPHPMTLGDLAGVIGLGKPSTSRLLHTLAATGFAAQDAAGNYYAARRIHTVSGSDWVDRLLAAATPEMERLNLDTAETVSLAVLFDDHIRVVHAIESPRHVRMSNYPNRILAPNASSLGKAIAAFQPPEDLHLLLQVYGIYQTTMRTITEPLLIRAEMERTRERGYSFEFEETVPGGCCFGAPVRPVNEPVRAAVSVSLPTSRFNDKLEKSLPALVLDTARRISKRLSVRRTS